jgi:hypothetical protein
MVSVGRPGMALRPTLYDTEAFESNFRKRATILGLPACLTEVAGHCARNLAWEAYGKPYPGDDEELIVNKNELTIAEGLRGMFTRLDDEESAGISERNLLDFYRLRTGRSFF